VTNPYIKTALPGPNARAMLARDVSVASPSYPRDYPFVMSHGRGTEVWDVDGNRFLDFVAGIAVCSTGHAHPRVVNAIKAAADKFLHVSSDYWHENMTRLTERLAEVAPMGEPVMSFLCQSGTESVEGAIKLARYVTAVRDSSASSAASTDARWGRSRSRRASTRSRRASRRRCPA